MRTNIEIDDALIDEAMKLSGLRTKKAAVEEALRDFVRGYRQRKALAGLEGLGWEGDLDASREGRGFDLTNDLRR